MKRLKLLTFITLASVLITGIKAAEAEEDGWTSDGSGGSVYGTLFDSSRPQTTIPDESKGQQVLAEELRAALKTTILDKSGEASEEILPADEEQKLKASAAAKPVHIQTKLEALTVEATKALKKDAEARSIYTAAAALVASSKEALTSAEEEAKKARRAANQIALERKTRDAALTEAQAALILAKTRTADSRRRHKTALVVVKKADGNTIEAEQDVIFARLTLDRAGLAANQTTLTANKLRKLCAEERPMGYFGRTIEPEDATTPDCYVPSDDEQRAITLHRERTARVVAQVGDYHKQKAKIEARLAKKK